MAHKDAAILLPKERNGMYRGCCGKTTTGCSNLSIKRS